MEILHLTSENFDDIIGGETPVLVDFWASWCGPCKMLAPVLEEVASEITNAQIAKVDVDEVPDLAKRFKVMSIPTLILFKNGEISERAVGYMPKEEILDLLK